MLVHIKELHSLPDLEDWDYEHAMTIAATKVKTYDKFVRFVEQLKKKNKDLIIGENWYTVEDYSFSFPKNDDHVPCLNVYVVSY